MMAFHGEAGTTIGSIYGTVVPLITLVVTIDNSTITALYSSRKHGSYYKEYPEGVQH